MVWFADDGRWADTLSRAAVVTTSEDALRLLDKAHGDEREAVGAYPAAVSLAEDGTPRPATLREKIRATGPTITYQPTA